MLAATLALFGALVYGAADFFGGFAAKRLPPLLVTALAATSGLVLLCVAYPLIGGAWHPVDIAWGAVSGVFGVLALALLYACLAIGPMSILSPLTAVVSAIAPITWGLIVEREALPPVGYAGLAVAIVAVVLIGFIPGEKNALPAPRGLLMAIGAGLAIGAFLVAIDRTSADSGLAPLIVSRTTNAVVTFTLLGAIAFLAARHRRAAPTADQAHPSFRSRAWAFAIACGFVDATANAMLLLALREGDLSVVSALTAMYPAGTIVLAAIVLRERIASVQWIGLALALAAAAMLAVA
jgi:drug/metabolite transporter (DMT)-like permease